MEDEDRSTKANARCSERDRVRLLYADLAKEKEGEIALQKSIDFQRKETAQERKMRFKVDGEKWIREKIKLRLTLERDALVQLKAQRKKLMDIEHQLFLEKAESAKQATERAARTELKKKMKFDRQRCLKEEKEGARYHENLRLIKEENEKIKIEKQKNEALEFANRKAKSLAIKERTDEAERVRLKLVEARLAEEERIFLLKSTEYRVVTETPLEKKIRFKAEGERWIREKVGQRLINEKVATVRIGRASKPSVDSASIGTGISNIEKLRADTEKAARLESERGLQMMQQRIQLEEKEERLNEEKRLLLKEENEKCADMNRQANAKMITARKARAAEVHARYEEAERCRLKMEEAKMEELNRIAQRSSQYLIDFESAQEKKKRFKAEGEKWIREKTRAKLNAEKESLAKSMNEKKLKCDAERKAYRENAEKIKLDMEKVAYVENEMRVKMNNERLEREEKERVFLKEKLRQIKIENERIADARLKAEAKEEAERRARAKAKENSLRIAGPLKDKEKNKDKKKVEVKEKERVQSKVMEGKMKAIPRSPMAWIRCKAAKVGAVMRNSFRRQGSTCSCSSGDSDDEGEGEADLVSLCNSVAKVHLIEIALHCIALHCTALILNVFEQS